MPARTAASLFGEACSSRDCSLGCRERHVLPFLPCHAPALHPGPRLLWVLGLPEPGPPGGDREHGAPGACLTSLLEPRCWGAVGAVLPSLPASAHCRVAGKNGKGSGKQLSGAQGECVWPFLGLCPGKPAPCPGGAVGDGSPLSPPGALAQSHLRLGPSPGSRLTLEAQSPGAGYGAANPRLAPSQPGWGCPRAQGQRGPAWGLPLCKG